MLDSTKPVEVSIRHFLCNIIAQQYRLAQDFCGLDLETGQVSLNLNLKQLIWLRSGQSQVKFFFYFRSGQVQFNSGSGRIRFRVNSGQVQELVSNLS